MPAISVLIKPASGKCNLRCEYCFYKDIADNRSVADFGLMALDTLEAIVRKVLAFADDHATFSFQGGEPTLRGLDFFRELIAYQQKYNVKNVAVSNCLQTNGILLDDEWAQFLHDNRFLVGFRSTDRESCTTFSAKTARETARTRRFCRKRACLKNMRWTSTSCLS
jgi:uncharacterized protein